MSSFPDAFQWQSQMADLIYSDDPADQEGKETGWRCASAIDADTVLMIYRRNLKRGVENNLKLQFPVTQAYLGGAGFRLVADSLLQALPPVSPLFSVFAAQFPGFILGFNQFDDQLRTTTAALSSIDFFSNHVSVPNKKLKMDQRFYELYRSIIKLQDESEVDGRNLPALYQLPLLHPETVAGASSVEGHVYSHLDDDGLIIKYESD